MNVSIEILEFPLCIKNKILRIKDITKLNIEYVSGKNIIFKNTNLGLFEPHKVIISNNCNENCKFCYRKIYDYNSLEQNKRIFALEQELGIIPQPKKYRNTLLRFLDLEFNKSRNVIQVAVHRMQKEFSCLIKFESAGMIFVKAEGVKWLHENYFRRDYLKEIEEYKWLLQNQKNNRNIKDKLKL